MTEKRTRSYHLPKVKELIEKNQIIYPSPNVRQHAMDMVFSVYEAHQEILKLEQSHFDKSMTDYYNNKVWWDVYKKKIKGISVYIKFKVVEDQFLLTSFKPDKPDES